MEAVSETPRALPALTMRAICGVLRKQEPTSTPYPCSISANRHQSADGCISTPGAEPLGGSYLQASMLFQV